MKNRLRNLILLFALAPGLLPAAMHGALTTYPDLTSFQIATAGATLTTEDFSNTLVPGTATACGPIVNNATVNPCFAAGAVQVGFTVLANDDNSDGSQDVVFIGIGALGSTENLVGANTFADSTEIQFTAANVTAVGFDVSSGFSPTNITVTAYDTSNVLIGAISLSLSAIPDTAFAGFTSPLPVSRVTVVAAGGEGDLIANLVFGALDPPVPVPTLSWISMLLMALGLLLTAKLVLRRKAI